MVVGPRSRHSLFWRFMLAPLLPQKPESLQHPQKYERPNAQGLELGIPRPKSGTPYRGSPQSEIVKRKVWKKMRCFHVYQLSRSV